MSVLIRESQCIAVTLGHNTWIQLRLFPKSNHDAGASVELCLTLCLFVSTVSFPGVGWLAGGSFLSFILLFYPPAQRACVGEGVRDGVRAGRVSDVGSGRVRSRINNHAVAALLVMRIDLSPRPSPESRPPT